MNDEIDVGRLDLRVGKIVEAKKHPDAEALYVETIDLGEEKPRTVVSGLVKHVPLDQVRPLIACLIVISDAKSFGRLSLQFETCQNAWN